MYIPKHFAETDIATLQALMQAHPLAAWVTVADGRLLVNHIPFLVDRTRGQCGTLMGHVARANPVWRSFSPSIPSALVFQGPEAYISPSWYPSKREDGRVVPTWNYAVVHAHGIPNVIEDREWLLRLVDRLTKTHESGRDAPWNIADAPDEYIDKRLGAIVGIEIPIVALEGKWKVSQNQPEANRRGVVDALRLRGDRHAEAMADLVARTK